MLPGKRDGVSHQHTLEMEVKMRLECLHNMQAVQTCHGEMHSRLCLLTA